jgi:hypothetical protein
LILLNFGHLKQIIFFKMWHLKKIYIQLSPNLKRVYKNNMWEATRIHSSVLLESEVQDISCEKLHEFILRYSWKARYKIFHLSSCKTEVPKNVRHLLALPTKARILCLDSL